MHISASGAFICTRVVLHVRGEIIVVKASDRVLGKNMTIS
jgi:hypothetical protein